MLRVKGVTVEVDVVLVVVLVVEVLEVVVLVEVVVRKVEVLKVGSVAGVSVRGGGGTELEVEVDVVKVIFLLKVVKLRMVTGMVKFLPIKVVTVVIPCSSARARDTLGPCVVVIAML